MKWLFLGMLVAACGSKAAPREPLSSKAPVAVEPVGPPIVVKLTSARDAICTCRDAGCAHTEQAKLRAWSDEFQNAKQVELDASARPQVEALFVAYEKCLLVAHERVPEGSTVPHTCDLYEFRIYQIGNCSSLPLETRKTLIDSYRQTQEAWASVPAEGQEALASACRAAADAVQQAAVSCAE